MTNSEFQDKMNSIQEKIGKESSALILDDIALLITDNQNMNKELQNKDNTIDVYKKRNDSLINVNGSLLQQISMGEDEVVKKTPEEEKKKEPFDFRSVFDEKGNFKK